jgi:hypothetical protein
MDIDSCIEAYLQLSELIFKKRRLNIFQTSLSGKPNSRYDAVQLERSIKQLCVRCGLEMMRNAKRKLRSIHASFNLLPVHPDLSVR